MKPLKPLLAAKDPVLADLTYPMLASPKIDGIRCLTLTGGAPVSRKLKDIPNEHVRAALRAAGIAGLDGELMIPGARNFGEVSSAIMRGAGRPDFTYHVFDVWDVPTMPFIDRLADLARRVQGAPSFIRPLIPVKVSSAVEVLELEAQYLAEGYEGVMLRAPHGPYKYGRSTLNEEILIKVKQFEDAEAVVVGMIEELHNGNVLGMDELGHAKRSSHQANKSGKGVLGALVCKREDGLIFKVGTGFTAEQRAAYWLAGEALLGSLVRYRFQPAGAKEAPRFPTFQGFRSRADL